MDRSRGDLCGHHAPARVPAARLDDMLSRAVELQDRQDEVAELVLERLAGGWSLQSTLSTARDRFGADGERRAHDLIVDGLLRSHGRVRASQA